MAKIDYTKLTDKELVDLINAIPHNEEAVYYILNDRYHNLIFKIFRDYFDNSIEWYGDCLNELFISLRGAKGDWNSFKNFEWRSNLRTWLSEVAKNQFLVCYKKMIEKNRYITSIDIEKISPIFFIDSSKQQRLIELMEAIGQLEDEDQRFCILKKLQGYSSKETAILLQKRWKKYGIVKYNNKNKIVIPSGAYVDVSIQRAKENLRVIMRGIK